MPPKMELERISDALSTELRSLRFGPPVAFVYNPPTYARRPYRRYLRRYGGRPKEILLLGMNPGPWGMVQTGVPFGDVEMVRGWLGIEAPVECPPRMHPKRPVLGFSCPRGEVSGHRLWGWARRRFGRPERFFARFFVGNYCPLAFLEESGRNRTPPTLPAAERRPLLAACDRALRRSVAWLGVRWVVGIGRFARERAEQALDGLDVSIGGITHPSPANPRANRGWEAVIEQELAEQGILLDG